MIKCAKCQFWDNSTTYNAYSDNFKKNYGLCRNEHFNEHHQSAKKTDNLVYGDFEGYSAGFDTGKDFGCIHGIKKEKKHESKD